MRAAVLPGASVTPSGIRMSLEPWIGVVGVSHRYGDRLALSDVSITIPAGTIFGLLGPNGGGKTTLFRLLSTLLPLQTGSIQIGGLDVRTQPGLVRHQIGVTFQAPSVDVQLTVRENLACQGHLYGLSGPTLRDRIDELTDRLELSDRRHDRVGTLSGGLQRRVEIAKCLLHRPSVLLLDEPTTGLDPRIRQSLWQTLAGLVTADGLTVLVTTHLLDEAERCHHLAILDRGRIVATGTPADLRATVGGDCITITPTDAALEHDLRTALGGTIQVLDGSLRIERTAGHDLLREIMLQFGPRVQSITLGRPTLEDVFIHHTGRRLLDVDESPDNSTRGRQRR